MRVLSRRLDASFAAGLDEALGESIAVALGLQRADPPASAVREAAVVEVDGVLRREDDADAERARLLEEREERLFRRRLGRGRKEAEDLVDVDERAERRTAGERAHPGLHAREQRRDDEEALGVAEVRDRNDREARLAVFRGSEHPPDVEILALPERGRGGRREEAVQRQHERLPVLRRIERVEGERADLRERRRRGRVEERLERGGLAVRPERVHAGREEDEVARLHGIGVAAREAEEAAHPRAHEVAAVLLVRAFGRRRARAEEVERDARRRAGRVDDGVAAREERLARPRGRGPSRRGRPSTSSPRTPASRRTDRRTARTPPARGSGNSGGGCRGRPWDPRRGPGSRAGAAPR